MLARVIMVEGFPVFEQGGEVRELLFEFGDFLVFLLNLGQEYLFFRFEHFLGQLLCFVDLVLELKLGFSVLVLEDEEFGL